MTAVAWPSSRCTVLIDARDRIAKGNTPDCVADGERSVGWVYVIPTRRQCIWVRAIGYCLAYLLPR
jgi:hypothetical protein